MFQSGVVAEGALAIVNEDGAQMNGAILGNAGSIFLAKFCATLAQQFVAKSEENGTDSAEFNQDAFNAALTETLAAYAHIDASQFGRLLCMKQILGTLSEEGRLTDEQLALIYLRDIAIIRELDLGDEGIVQAVMEEPPSGDEIQ